MTGPSSPSLTFTDLCTARHPQIPIADSQGLRNEAATFALCYGPEDCLPSIGKDFYDQASTPSGRPAGALVITTRATSRVPGPDFHRQDTRPYGLRHRLRRCTQMVHFYGSINFLVEIANGSIGSC